MQHVGNGANVRELLAAALVNLSAGEVMQCEKSQDEGQRKNGEKSHDEGPWKKGEKSQDDGPWQKGENGKKWRESVEEWRVAVEEWRGWQQNDAEVEWMKGEKLQDEAEGRELAEEAESGIDSP